MTKLDSEVQEDILNELKRSFNNLNELGQKKILKEIGLSKIDIDKIDHDNLVYEFVNIYTKVLDGLDLDNMDQVDPKYIIVNEYLSGDNKKEFETKQKNY